MSLFSYEGKLIQALQKFADTVYVSLLWFLFSIPIFTIGASTSALYYTVQKSIIHSRGYVWQEFWSAFKQNFKKATAVWVVLLVLIAFATINFLIFYKADPAKSLRDNGIWFAIMLFPLLGFYVWFFPYISRFENKLKTSIKNSFFFAYRYLQWTILLILLLVIFIIISVMLFPLVAITPTLYMCLCCIIQEKIFRSYLSEEELLEEDLRNNPEIDKEQLKGDKP